MAPRCATLQHARNEEDDVITEADVKSFGRMRGHVGGGTTENYVQDLLEAVLKLQARVTALEAAAEREATDRRGQRRHYNRKMPQ